MLTPTAPVPPFPVEKNYPEVIQGRKLHNYMDWIGPTFLVSLAGAARGETAGGIADRRAEILRADDSDGGEVCRSGAPDRIAAELRLR